MLDGARIGEDDVVLDAGTGIGTLARAALGRVGADGMVIALDPSVDLLDELRESCADPRLSFLVGDAAVVPLPDASLDVVLGRSVLGSARSAPGVVVELRRGLRPGGGVSLCEAVDLEDVDEWLTEAGFVEVDIGRGAAGTFVLGRTP